jgi:hypothetical protein
MLSWKKGVNDKRKVTRILKESTNNIFKVLANNEEKIENS